MKMKEFDDFLAKNLKKNSKNFQLLFGVLVAEKLIPNYHYFSVKHNWGNTALLHECTDFCYGAVGDITSTVKQNAIILMDSLLEITPDLDDYEGGTSSYANDTCAAYEQLLTFIIEEKLELIISVADYSIASVDMFIQEKYDLNPNDSELEIKILSDAHMKQELIRQKEILKFISSFGRVITDEKINQIREFNNNLPSLIDLELLYKY
jgi:uncharacterized protein YjaG (DUF416 family)